MARLLVRVAGESDADRRLDQVLAGWLDEPRSRTQQRLASGEVAVDGRLAGKSHRVRPGEEVTVARPPPAARVDPPPPVPVRWADEHLMVIAKPAGLVVHPGAGTSSRPTLVDALRGQGVGLAIGGDPERPGIVHRLDRGTSGLLAVACSMEAYAGLVLAFRRHAVERVYWALVDGVPDPPRATIEAPITRSRSQRTRFAVDPAGRAAVSHYDVEAAHRGCAELSVRLDTGRTHQVRVHLSAVGHPVAGDRTYGASVERAAALGLRRPALHARRLAFEHPVTGERVAVDEPLPDDLAAARSRAADRGLTPWRAC
ncbi:RluA family pseudouridine synthase [soil metagenome]